MRLVTKNGKNLKLVGKNQNAQENAETTTQSLSTVKHVLIKNAGLMKLIGQINMTKLIVDNALLMMSVVKLIIVIRIVGLLKPARMIRQE